MTQLPFLSEALPRLLFFGGKGGVGKTTCAVAAALTIASERPAEKLLLLSTDPAPSILDALAGMPPPVNLSVIEMDAAAMLKAFKGRHEASLREIAERGTFLDEEDIHGLMDLSLPGMDELVAYLELSQWLEEKRYDRVIVDTAPTGHTLRLLEMPNLVRRWLKALDALLAKHRYMRQHFARRSELDHLDHFLLELSGSLKGMESLLHDHRQCRFVPVMLAETMSVEETRDLIAELQGKRIPLGEMVVNRRVPRSDCPVCAAERFRQDAALVSARQVLPVSRFWCLPLLADEPRGEALNALWPQAELLVEDDQQGVPADIPGRVEAAAACPSPGIRLLMFAGKGGVGKTTIACATALHLRTVHESARILLFSSDPAHSLADCLRQSIGDTPKSLLPRLDAQEIDADVAFIHVREGYRKELQNFLKQAMPNFDLTFDRQVMEHLMDLAPPGLDEIMALTAVMDHLNADAYDLIVLDAAPSGHLIRLLEMPHLIEEWLKLFFSMLLKYRNVLRLPRLSEQLVALSRKLKALRALLADPARSALYAITLPTALAIAETDDLLAMLDRLDVAVPVLFINQITPPSACPLCAALHQRETAQLTQASARFTAQHQVLVYRQTEPKGLEALERFGRALYAAPADVGIH